MILKVSLAAKEFTANLAFELLLLPIERKFSNDHLNFNGIGPIFLEFINWCENVEQNTNRMLIENVVLEMVVSIKLLLTERAMKWLFSLRGYLERRFG